LAAVESAKPAIRPILIFRIYAVGLPKSSDDRLDRIRETEEALEKAITNVWASFAMNVRSRVP
jgi:hypothetical protein